MTKEDGSKHIFCVCLCVCIDCSVVSYVFISFVLKGFLCPYERDQKERFAQLYEVEPLTVLLSLSLSVFEEKKRF